MGYKYNTNKGTLKDDGDKGNKVGKGVRLLERLRSVRVGVIRYRSIYMDLMPVWWKNLKSKYGINLFMPYWLFAALTCRRILRLKVITINGKNMMDIDIIVNLLFVMMLVVLLANLLIIFEYILFVSNVFVLILGLINRLLRQSINSRVTNPVVTRTPIRPNGLGSGGGRGQGSDYTFREISLSTLIGTLTAVGALTGTVYTLSDSYMYVSGKGFNPNTQLSPLQRKLAIAGITNEYFKLSPETLEQSMEIELRSVGKTGSSEALLNLEIQNRQLFFEKSREAIKRGDVVTSTVYLAKSNGYW